MSPSRDPIGYSSGISVYVNHSDLRLADPLGLEAFGTKARAERTFGLDTNVFHEHHHAPGSGGINFNKFGLPCEFDLRGYGECTSKNCTKCCDGHLATYSETGCKGGFNGLLKCHSPNNRWGVWEEFGGKLRIELNCKRKQDSCDGSDYGKFCIDAIGSVF